MTKKKLIDLMIENNVQWPEGAEFAAQDKDCKVWFYRHKPHRESCEAQWECDSNLHVIGSPKTLPELCLNWHQAIVTREKYEKAAYEKVVYGAGHVNGGDEAAVVDIINQIAHHQSESQRHEEAILEHNDKELDLREQLNDMLAKVGMKVVDVEREVVAENGGWPDYCDEDGIITDWDEVPEGARIECVHSEHSWFDVGDVTNVRIDGCGDKGPFSFNRGFSSYSGVRDGECKFRLIK